MKGKKVRLAPHGGLEIKRRQQNTASRGCQIGWLVRETTAAEEATATATTEAAPSDDDTIVAIFRNTVTAPVAVPA